MKAVEVVWQDAFDLAPWFSKVDLDAAMNRPNQGKSRSRGWLYHEDDERIVLVRDWQPDVEALDEESMAGVIIIPRGMIREIIIEHE